MKVFLDTEFSSLRKMSSRLISIGLVAEDGSCGVFRTCPGSPWTTIAATFQRPARTCSGPIQRSASTLILWPRYASG